MLVLQDILNSLQLRQTDTRWGIGTALQHMSQVQSCFGSGLCPVKSFSLSDSKLWEKELADAANRLTFCDSDMAVKDFDAVMNGIQIASKLANVQPILAFDAVLTSKSKDRDGDVIEPAGFNVDESMPLLWQHIQLQPIGKMVGVVSRNDNLIRVKAAICDTELGRDAATLVKFGALRISHGFKPREFEPLGFKTLADGRQVVAGWHVKAADCLEMSLVSIPSNADAVITAFQEKSLESPLFKAFAERLFAKQQSDKPAQVQGFSPSREVTLEIKGKSRTVVWNPVNERWQDAETKQFVAKSEVEAANSQATQPAAPQPVEQKQVAELATKDAASAMDSTHLEGSWEWTESKLWKSARQHLSAKVADFTKNNRQPDYVQLVATYPDYGILCCETYTGNGYDRRCFKSSWKMDGDMPKWDGDPTEVEIKAQVIEKSLQDRGDINRTDATPEQLAKRLVAKSVMSGRDGLKALRIAADAAVELARDLESQELADYLSIS